MHKPSIFEERVEVPARPARELCGEAAAELTLTITTLRGWGARIADDSRLHQAHCILSEVARTGLFAPHQRGDDLGMRALELALDLRAIASTLPAFRVTDLRKDIEGASLGVLAPKDSERGPLQLQSQLNIRAALELMGVAVDHPRYSTQGGRKKPDILVRDGSIEYAIEVKRPEKAKNILGWVAKGAEQIASAGLQGGIVLDITDAIASSSAEETDALVLHWVGRAAAVCFQNGVGPLPGMSHVLMVTVMARPMWVVEPKGDNAQILVQSTSAGYAFGMRPGTLAHIRGAWMRRTVNHGLNKLGFTASESTGDRASSPGMA